MLKRTNFCIKHLISHGAQFILVTLPLLLAAPAAAESTKVATLPVQSFAQNGYIDWPALSPNGRYLAGSVFHQGNTTVLVWDLDTDKKTPVARLEKNKQYLHRVRWANNDRLLVTTSLPDGVFYSDGTGGRKSWLLGVNRDGSDLRTFAKYWFKDAPGSGNTAGTRRRLPRVQSGADVLHTLPDDPEHILMQIEHVDPGANAWRIGAFDRMAQFLANRGFAVLQPNFRGSTGFDSGGWQGRRPRNSRSHRERA